MDAAANLAATAEMEGTGEVQKNDYLSHGNMHIWTQEHHTLVRGDIGYQHTLRMSERGMSLQRRQDYEDGSVLFNARTEVGSDSKYRLVGSIYKGKQKRYIGKIVRALKTPLNTHCKN